MIQSPWAPKTRPPENWHLNAAYRAIQHPPWIVGFPRGSRLIATRSGKISAVDESETRRARLISIDYK
jgi:hypothetical protein